MAEQPMSPEPQEGAPVEPEAPAVQSAAGASPVAVPGAAEAGAPSVEAPEPVSAAPAEPVQTASEPPAPTATGATPPPPPPAAAPVPPAPQPAAPQPKPVYSKGCVAAAWDDIKATPDWLKKMLFLGLLSCVPILNFVVYGYALNWAREVPFGGRTAMPGPVVTGRNFEVGFYYVVISLAFSIPVAIVSFPVSFIPVLGSLVTIALSFGVELFVVLAVVRMALSNRLGEGFKLPQIWEALKANFPGLLFIAVVPSLVAGAVMVALVFICAGIGAAVLIPLGMAAGWGSSASALATAVTAVPALIAIVLLILVAVFVCMVISAFLNVLMLRATAHYVGRYAPAWADQAKAAMGYAV